MLQRTTWSRVPALLAEQPTRDAALLSFVVAGAAAAACLMLGLPLGFTLARARFRGLRVVRAFVLLPMVLPPVAGGTALLFAFGRRGLVGQWLERWFGVTLPVTTAGAIVAATFVALPFFVLAVEAALEQLDPELEETAASLGSSPSRVFFTVTVPLIRPAMLAGLTLAWARALGEFGATIAFAGDSPGRTRTLPLALYRSLQTEPDRALVIGLVLVAAALTVLVALRSRWLVVR
jgi:molybdate transport system permease protein